MGSNLDDPASQFLKAYTALSTLPKTKILAESKIYSSEPIGVAGQDRYLNAVVAIKTAQTPDALLNYFQEIERNQARVKTQVWGPRTIDLDLLWYDHYELNTDKLTIPHPEIHNRSFVVFPLLDLKATWTLWGQSLELISKSMDKTQLMVVANDFKALAETVLSIKD